MIQLEDLKERCCGRTKTIIRILDSFQATSTEIQQRLTSAEDSGDQAQLAKALHAIKGLLGEIAAVEGAQAVAGLEIKLRETKFLTTEDLASVREWIKASCRSAEIVKNQLKSTPQS